MLMNVVLPYKYALQLKMTGNHLLVTGINDIVIKIQNRKIRFMGNI
ncbi:hypothetical protein CKO_00440 [Citrobacter koseri ATCC BAA-895]|uniref:Uncharacterized protein n=1 Tax=Citrobacter koseri (strain ATCC BAA-895 / CDC 4225-83 / SGSC4696) TaxID=290338 RepID=A8ADN4_CITK8|nr:hypothetical protein CKO_00440 [Citrobacter koseri ATCC BAA-895]